MRGTCLDSHERGSSFGLDNGYAYPMTTRKAMQETGGYTGRLPGPRLACFTLYPYPYTAQ